TPSATSARASEATCAAAPVQLVACQAPSRLRHRKGLSPFSAARSKNMLTRFGQSVRCIPLPRLPARCSGAGFVHGTAWYLARNPYILGQSKESPMATSTTRRKPVDRLGPLPEWDLSDLYPAPDSKALKDDLDKAEKQAKRSEERRVGKEWRGRWQ